jgi:2-methylcitrate dehydratase PrpD
MKLDEDGTRNTLGIVGSFAAGLIAAQESGMVKRLHAGRAAQGGVMAARLARSGFTGIQDVFENPVGGFCHTMGGGEEDLALLTQGLGTVWEVVNTGFKIHASCGATHSAVDVTQELLREHGFAAEDVESMRVHASSHAVLHSGWAYKPVDVTSAQMNYFFVLAAALRFGEVSLDALTEEGIRDPLTLELADRIEVYADPEVDALGRPGRYGVRVEVRLRDGRELVGTATQRKGSKLLPVPDSDVHAKFRRLASTALPPDRVDDLMDRALRLETLGAASELTATMVTEA